MSGRRAVLEWRAWEALGPGRQPGCCMGLSEAHGVLWAATDAGQCLTERHGARRSLMAADVCAEARRMVACARRHGPAACQFGEAVVTPFHALHTGVWLMWAQQVGKAGAYLWLMQRGSRCLAGGVGAQHGRGVRCSVRKALVSAVAPAALLTCSVAVRHQQGASDSVGTSGKLGWAWVLTARERLSTWRLQRRSKPLLAAAPCGEGRTHVLQKKAGDAARRTCELGVGERAYSPVSMLLGVRAGTLVGRAAFFSFLGAGRVEFRHANSRLDSCQSRTCSL